MLESELVTRVKKKIEGRGHLCWKMHGSVWTPVGFPDLFGVLKGSGMFYAIELKAPGKKPSPAQVAFIKRLTMFGVPAFWTDNEETVERWLDSLSP